MASRCEVMNSRKAMQYICYVSSHFSSDPEDYIQDKKKSPAVILCDFLAEEGMALRPDLT